MCFAWIWEQTAIISLYSINLFVFITEAECLLRGTATVSSLKGELINFDTACITYSTVTEEISQRGGAEVAQSP
jgi:hypothetical protein